MQKGVWCIKWKDGINKRAERCFFLSDNHCIYTEKRQLLDQLSNHVNKLDEHNHFKSDVLNIMIAFQSAVCINATYILFEFK